jgi:hypothetical protein
MPEYVYALHDFVPENSDEIAFRAGEAIEVVEKDDIYSDGWWQVSVDHPISLKPSCTRHYETCAHDEVVHVYLISQSE